MLPLRLSNEDHGPPFIEHTGFHVVNERCLVHGSRKVLPKGELLVRPGTIEVEVLDPVPKEEEETRPREEIMEEVNES